MEKIERVLAAEEDARTTLIEARDRAAAIRANAVDEAHRLEADAARATAEAVAAQRDRLLAAAIDEAARFAEAAQAERSSAIDKAEGRLDAVAARLATMVEG